MRVLLCSTYELGHQPLSLASPAAFLLDEGFEVKCKDLSIESLDESLIHWADWVGISVPMHTAIRIGARLAEEIKVIRPELPICFYGLYASLNATYLLSHGGDSIVGGEYEERLLQYCRRLRDGDSLTVDGIQTTQNSVAVPFLGRQQFKVPARGLLPGLQHYAQLEHRGELKLVGYVEASHGCAHQCLHCPIPAVYEGRLRIVQEDVVVDDIRQLVDLGAEHIDFGDPDFLNGVKHSLRIVRRMHSEFPHLTFNITTRIEHIHEHEAAIRELASLGCLFIQTAVEALNDRILVALDKGHTANDVRRAIQVTRDVGVELRPTFVSFTPWTTLDDYLEVLDFVEENQWIPNVPPVQYTIRLLVPPGSCLLGKPQTQGLLGELNEELFTYEWRHPDARMDDLYTEVSDLVAQAEATHEDPKLTFYRIKSAASSLARGVRAFMLAHRDLSHLPDPPKLTETWFC